MTAIFMAATTSFGGIKATINPGSVNASGSGFTACGNPGSTGIASVTVTPSGSYTYSWQRTSPLSGSGGFQANSASSASTTFQDSNANVCDGDSPSSETWKCVIDGTVDTDNDVTVTITWINLN